MRQMHQKSRRLAEKERSQQKMVALHYLLLLLPALLSPAAVVSAGAGVPAPQDPQTNHRNLLLAGELREAKLKVASLESALEDITENVKAREHYLAGGEKQIEDMEKKLMQLHSTLSSLKGDSLLVAEKINMLEEEVRGLWGLSRRNNFDLYILESQAQEAEDRLEIVTSQVEKMDDVVTEQWIQIQQLEQALEFRIRVLLAQRQAKLLRCTFLKFMNVISGKYIPKELGLLDLDNSPKASTLRSYMSQTLHQLKGLFSTVKEFHHQIVQALCAGLPTCNWSSVQLQAVIRQEIERHKFTASLANKELLFFVASALIVFPVLSAWTLLSSKFP